VDIGRPKRIIEIEPADLPLPETTAIPEPEPSPVESEPSPVESEPAEPVPAEPAP
jgi:hypothetical protein